jgi:hypothetical protein
VINKALCFLLLLPILELSAQDSFANKLTNCSEWVLIKKDSTGKETLTASNETLVSSDGGKTGLNIYSFLNSTSKVVVISVQAIGAGKCVDKGDKISIIFEDGEKIELANTNDFNCDGSSTIYFGSAVGRQNEIKMLASKRVNMMTVWTRDTYMQKEFSKADSQKLMETLRCLSAALIE